MQRLKLLQKMRNGKRGLFDIEDFFAVLVYVLILFILLVIMSLPQCSRSVVQGLASNAASIDRLSHEQTLLEMLKTQLPDNLPDLIGRQANKEISMDFTLQPGLAEATTTSVDTNESFPIYKGIDKDAAIKMLQNNPQLYKEKIYAEFIDSLQFSVKNSKERENTFAVVTRALFIHEVYPPHMLETMPELKKVLTYPELYVKYNTASSFKANDADLANRMPAKPLSVDLVGTTKVKQASVGEALAIIPVTDGSAGPRTAAVMLSIYPGISNGN